MQVQCQQKEMEDYEDLPESQSHKFLAFLGNIDLNKVDLNDKTQLKFLEGRFKSFQQEQMIALGSLGKRSITPTASPKSMGSLLEK